MNAAPNHQTRILPALRDIQARFGYLKREELLAFAQESGIPLYRLQAVASFFPHFRFEPAPALTIQVCRDMACHMAGADNALAALKTTVGDQCVVEGVSCLGRCDRAPAACFTTSGPASRASGHDAEHHFLGRSTKELTAIATAFVSAGDRGGATPAPDRDATHASAALPWKIDHYQSDSPVEPYLAVRKVAAARMQAIEAAADELQVTSSWPRERTDLFSLAAARRQLVPFEMDDSLREAILDWQSDQGWAKGPATGGWSDAFLAELDDAHADLRGLGGAGIPATQKWRDVRDAVRSARKRKQDDRAYIVVNGDESEPGTFKDRELLLRAPHLVVEAVVIAGLITDATEGFIYIRHEYPEQIEACEREIRRAEELGVCGATASLIGRPFRVSVFVSPGGYICGEQSALLEAMSDRRAEPRNMPPKLETNGLNDRPTLVSNVETFAWVPYILLNGGQAYASQGVNGWRGRRFFSVSGDVNRPGVYETPMGLTLRELIEGKDYCQGMKDGRKLKAIAPSGPSGGFLPARLTAKAGLPRDHTKNKSWLELAKRRGFDPAAQDLDILDLELELNLFRALSPTQALGAGIVVYAEGRDMAEQAFNAIEFFRNESCGKCVPCRIGSQKLAVLGENVLAGRVNTDRWDSELHPLVSELGRAMELSSICGLGRATPAPLRTVMEFFPEDLAAHLTRSNGNTAPPLAATAVTSPEIQR